MEKDLQKIYEEKNKDIKNTIESLTTIIQNLVARITLAEHQYIKMENHLNAVGAQIELVQNKVNELMKPLDKEGKMSIAKFIKRG